MNKKTPTWTAILIGATPYPGRRPEYSSGNSILPPTGRTSSTVRKIATGAVGGTVTAAGVIMLVTPGPGVVVALAGLAILGREFPSVRRRLDSARDAVSSRLSDRR